jgi:hypothetical protein
MSISKSAIAAAAGIVGAGAIAGVAYAAVSTPATASGNVSGPADSTVAAATGQPGATAGTAGLGRRALLNRLEHGELTLRTKKGDVTVDVQRGTVTAVSPTSITVKSLDGYTHSYAVTSATKVRVGKQRGAISGVHAQDKVLLVGTAGNALRIVDRG